MMESLSLEEGNIIKDIRNLFRLKKELNYTATKDIALRDIKNLFEHEDEKNYYKPVRVSNFWSTNYIEFESNGDININKTISVEEYLTKIRPYLKDVMNNLKTADTWANSINNNIYLYFFHR